MEARVPASFERTAAAEAVAKRAFRPFEAGDDGPNDRAGWVTIHDPLATEFTPADLFFQHYLAVGFRFDRRTVPAQLLRLERRRVEAERAAERGAARLGAAARREVKLEIESRLIAMALPTPRLIDCLWNLETGRLFVSGGSRAVREAFAECFRATFGVMPIPMIPYLAVEHLGLSARAVELVRESEASSLRGDAAPAEARPDRPPRLPIALEEHPQ